MRRALVVATLCGGCAFAVDAKDAELKLLKAQLVESSIRLQLESHPVLVQAKAAVIAAQQELEAAKKAEAPKPETAKPQAP